MTVREVRAWLANLPEAYQDAPFESTGAGGNMPLALKRIVAYKSISDPNDKGVCANPMGSHLPFDQSLMWEHVLHD